MQQADRWTLRFEPGEPQLRIASGEWTNKTIADYATEMLHTAPDTVLIVSDGQPFTVRNLFDRAQSLARGLRTIGLESGDTVSFQLPNWVESAVINLACALGGFVINPIIPIYRSAELRFILKDCRAKVMFVPEEFRGVNYPEMIQSLHSDLPELSHLVVVRGSSEHALTYDAVLDRGRASDASLTPAPADFARLIIYTSGTTGPPKGVIYSHNQARRAVADSFEFWRLQRGATFLVGTPVTHVTGFIYGLDAPFYFASRSVLMEKWIPSDAVRLIDDHQVNVMCGATPFLTGIVAEAQNAGSSLPSLRIFLCGGAPVPPNLIHQAQEAFTGCRTFRGFGSSECPMITQGCLDDPNLAATTDGQIFGYEVKVVDEDGNRLPPDTDGELLAKGAAMFRGYTDSEATRAAFDDEGFFQTGDIGRITQAGFLTVTGRKKDLIIRGGENLSPKEIEDALHTHPDIQEAAVTAMPDARMGETVCVFVIPRYGQRPDRSELASFLKSKGLAPQKWPERVEYVEDLPRTPSGKVQKHLLRQMISHALEQEQTVGA